MKGRQVERGVMALASLVWTGVWLVQVARAPVFAPFVERLGSDLAAAHDRALVRELTPEGLAARISARLDEAPRDWVVIAALMDLAATEGIPVPEALRARHDLAQAADHGWLASGRACAACAWDMAACDLSGALACGLAVNLTVLGDVVALAREGAHHAMGEPVDTVDVAIAVVGIGATGLVVATGGTSLAVKGGAALLRVAHRTGRLAPEVLAVFRRAAAEGIDWARLPAVRGADEVAALARPAVIRPAVAVAQDLGRLHDTLGTRQALHLLGRLDTPAQIARTTRAAEVLGPRTLGAFEVLGRSRFLRLGVRLADEVVAVLAGVLGLIASGAGLLAPLVMRAVRPLLRLLLR